VTIALAHERFDQQPADQNVARSDFHYGGCVTVREILVAIAGLPAGDHVNLIGPVEEPRIFVCRESELPKFFGEGFNAVRGSSCA
jgi:hypothetical protein